ncbi:unnamed protein product [Phyllotreta striolata]|uniref:Daxx histone-binding domain-containing protein n=1 Tax=Phyllotreta striolata TaxID=444603 RepID=A0A9N9THK8_PHYSR|nr:unnamed protein product [Phyllotreta striolata]
MDDVITVLSSDDENEKSPARPKKRLNPIFLKNLVEISVTKVKAPKKTNICTVDLCSDDEENVTTEATDKLHNETTNCNENVITLDDEDTNTVENTTSENATNNICTEDIENGIVEDSEPSESGGSQQLGIRKLLERFVETVNRQIQDEKYESIRNSFPRLWINYKKCQDELDVSVHFKNLLSTNIEKAESSPAAAVISFHEVFQELKDMTTSECIEVEDTRTLMNLKKLEKCIKKLIQRIKQLDEQEVDFNEEEDSTFLKAEKFKTRLNQVYKTYCKLLKRNPYKGRIIHARIDFVHSEFNEINRAICKKYKTNKTFPCYYEMEKLITDTDKEFNLGLSESKIKSESKHCFQKLGELMQLRRRKDLYDSHCSLLSHNEDPAKADPQLENILKKNYEEGQSKIAKVVQEYAEKQDVAGEEPQLNESGNDSDKSDEDSVGEEEEQEEEDDEGGCQENGIDDEDVNEMDCEEDTKENGEAHQQEDDNNN